MQCFFDAWNKQQQYKCKGFHVVDFGSEEPNDDTCSINGNGGFEKKAVKFEARERERE